MNATASTALAVMIAVGAVVPRGAHSQVERPVHWTAVAPHTSVARGDSVRVTVKASIDEFFHLYSTTQGPGGPVPTTVRLLVSPHWAHVGKLRVPPPDTIPDANFGIMSEVYDDSVAIGLTLRLSDVAISNVDAPRIAVRFQACTTRYCLPARTDTVVVPVALSDGIATRAEPSPPIDVGDTARPAGAASADAAVNETSIATYGGANGVGAFLLLAASMGALALLTPCVFPMIPITVTSFIAVSDDRKRGITQAALYALGIVAGFAVLGLATSVLFGAAGLARFSAHPIVNLAIAALFTVFALSLLGIAPIRVPGQALVRLASLRSSSTVAGPLLMGGIFTVTAFTCTAPFVGTLLVLSSQGNWRWPLAGMLVFASVFAAPFFALALVPGVLRKRPTSGEWMPALEMVVGAIELAAAVKFISNADMVLRWGILTRDRVVAIWIVIFVALAVALLRRTPQHDAERPKRGAFRPAAAIGALALTALLIPGLFGHRLGEIEAFLPPRGAVSSATNGPGEPDWMLNDYPAALLAANRERRPILIDFTGYTCTNCRWMEANMFPRGEVQEELRRYVRVRLYTDGMGEPFDSHQRLEERLFGTVALPLYAVLDPSGRPRAKFLGMTRDVAEFRDFLKDAAR